MSQRNKLVINFYGAPSSGKTVGATSLFSKLKREHMDAVLITEHAHSLAVEENHTAFTNQLWVWATQQYKIHCGYRHADVVVTDSPIPLGAIYNTDASPALHQVIWGEYHKYNNLNLMMELDGTRPYSMVGRVHSFTEAMSIQNEIVEMLDDNDVPFLYYNETTEDDIVALVKSLI